MGAPTEANHDQPRQAQANYARIQGDRRPYPIFFRAGAALPTRTDIAYVQKIRAAGGFKRYERNHLNAITATFAPKLSHVLPPELVRRVVEYAFHAGDY